MLPFESTLFLRLVFGLLIDLLIANGYLLPSQREVWVNGAVSVIGAAGAAVLLIIYQHNSHKKDLLGDSALPQAAGSSGFQLKLTETGMGLLVKLLALVKGFAVKTPVVVETPEVQ